VPALQKKPDAQCWPPLPHAHAPAGEQRSLSMPQVTHTAPPVPHAARTGEATQVAPEPKPLQQPPGQLCASHMHWPAMQCWPG
jgi:hypothetical protein